MLNKKTYDHYWASDLFQLIEEKTGENYEDELMELWNLTSDISVMFQVNSKDKMMEYEKIRYYLTTVLLENGCPDGTTIYLDF